MAAAALDDLAPPPSSCGGRSSLTPTMPADAADGHGNQFLRSGGFTLINYDECERDERFSTFFAEGEGRSILLQVSPHNFQPTQARFDWLVRNGFPAGFRTPSGALASWSDAEIDARIASEAGQ
jgi:hypothetical protein